MRVSPRFSQSIEVHRGTIRKTDGALIFTGTPESTVSGVIFSRRAKRVEGAGEVFEITAQGFLQADADVQRRDHLVIVAPATVSGLRFEVYTVPSAIDNFSVQNHVGVELRDTKAY